jgi:hypothetical protein
MKNSPEEWLSSRNHQLFWTLIQARNIKMNEKSHVLYVTTPKSVTPNDVDRECDFFFKIKMQKRP